MEKKLVDGTTVECRPRCRTSPQSLHCTDLVMAFHERWSDCNDHRGNSQGAQSSITVVAVSVDLVDPNYSTGSIFPGALLQLRGRLKAATWNLVPGYGATDIRKYQVTGDGLRSSEESQDFNLNFVTKVDISPGLELTFLKIFLLPIAIFDGTRGSTVRGLILTPTTEEAGIYERVAHFTFTGERASYFFVEISTESQQ